LKGEPGGTKRSILALAWAPAEGSINDPVRIIVWFRAISRILGVKGKNLGGKGY